MNISRRGFLRAIGVTSMGILVPKLILPVQKELPKDYWAFTWSNSNGSSVVYCFRNLPPGKYNITARRFAKPCDIKQEGKCEIVINGKPAGDPRVLKSVIVA